MFHIYEEVGQNGNTFLSIYIIINVFKTKMKRWGLTLNNKWILMYRCTLRNISFPEF